MITAWQNETGPVSAPTLIRSLNHLLDSSERGLPVHGTRTCSIPGCTRGGKLSRGWCGTHYERWRKTGTTDDPIREARFCSLDDCNQPHYGLGLCALHWRRQSVTGSTAAPAPKPTICIADDCDRKPRSNGYCPKHFARWRRHGDPLAGRVERGSRPDVCTVDGCDGAHLAGGYCSLHWQRVYKHGDLEHERSMPTGEDHHNWTGDAATYGGVHQRVRYQRGSATNYSCADCGDPAAHWSYDNADPDERVCPELGLRYSVDLDRYSPRCVLCHSRFDRGVT